MLKSDVVNYFGSIAKTARALRISYQAVKKWPEELTDRIAWKVELVTNGALKTNETFLLKGINNGE